MSIKLFRKFMLPKRRFWKVGQTFQKGFSKHFSRVWVLYLGYTTLKSASKNAFWNVCPTFQNLRLGGVKFIHPKRRFWNEEPKTKSGFSKHFSRTWVLDLRYEPLKRQSKNPDFIFGSSFQNLRLGSIKWCENRTKALNGISYRPLFIVEV